MELGVPVRDRPRTSTSSSSSTGSCGRGATPMPRFPSSWPRGNASPELLACSFDARLSQPAKPGRPRRHGWNSTPCPPRAACPPAAAVTRGAAGLRTGAPAASRPSSRQSTKGETPEACARTPKTSPKQNPTPLSGSSEGGTNRLSNQKSLPDVARENPPALARHRAAGGSPCPILPEITNMGAKIPARPPFTPINVADQVRLTLNRTSQVGVKLDGIEAGSNSKKGVFRQTLTRSRQTQVGKA